MSKQHFEGLIMLSGVNEDAKWAVQEIRDLKTMVDAMMGNMESMTQTTNALLNKCSGQFADIVSLKDTVTSLTAENEKLIQEGYV